MARPRKGRHDVENTRRSILDAAARVLARHGYSGATMRAMAAEAGCSPPTLYEYFKGKRGILDGLIEQVVADSQTLFAVAFPAGLSLRQKLEMLLHDHNQWLEDHRDAFIFLARHARMLPRPGDEKPDLTHLYVDRLARWLGAQEEVAEVDPRRLQSAAYAIWGIQHAWFLRWLRAGTPGSLNDGLPEALEYIFAGLPGALAAPA